MGYIGEDIYIFFLSLFSFSFLYMGKKKLRFALVDTFNNGLTD